MPLSYFDTVSNDELTQIVYEIKDPPPSLLFSTPLVSVSESLFHNVILDNDSPLRLFPARRTIKFGETNGENGGPSIDSVEFILRIIHRFIKRVEIVAVNHGDDDDRENGPHYAAFIALVLEHCERVVELEFMGPVDVVDVTQFLTRYGAQLSVLEFPTEVNTMSIIRSPCILPKLRLFSFFCGYIQKISWLWRVSGDTLEEVFLDMSHENDFTSVVEDMRPYCPKLCRLMLFESETSPVIPKHAHVELLMSYGCQLVEASLDTLGVMELKQLVVHCPNLRCAIREELGRIERIFAAAPITKRLNVIYSGGKDALLAESLALCKNLIHLNLTHENVALESIITAPLSSLQKIEISLFPTKEEVELIARFTTGLKSLNVEFRNMDDGSVFEMFATTNGATLEEIRMRDYPVVDGERDVLKWIGELVECFLTRCESLRYFWIIFSRRAPDQYALDTLLLPLKRKGVRCDVMFLDF